MDIKGIDDEIKVKRHTMAHVLACAVKELFGNVKFGIGPAIDTGFYYDFDMEHTLNPNDYGIIEKKMKEIINQDLDMIKEVISKEDALKLFKYEPYKLELINEMPEGEEISIYHLGNVFDDLCRGPHVKNTKVLRNIAFKIDRVSGAYWRGSEKNKMMQRMYVYCYDTTEELKQHLLFIEEASKRDHRKLGRELGLFSLSEFAPGMPFYLPNGLIVKNELIKMWREYHIKAKYLEIETPMAMNRKLWEISGHWNHYKDNMYTFIADEGDDYAIKPMNCPGAILYYKENMHSYKELPLRIAELGKVHRKESSGTLHGLLRVRCFTQDDAHIFIMPEQLTDEIINILSLEDKIYNVFGLKYHLELSTMPEDHVGTVEEWRIAEDGLKKALISCGKDFVINEGDGAFYGPKIDIHIQDALGRTWQCGTIQLDMQLPKRFDIDYVSREGSKETPYMLHRVVFGSIDRFMGIIIEHFAGAFPLWLSPNQVKVITINDKFVDYAKNINSILEREGVRSEIDDRNESLSYRVREAVKFKTPYILIIGEKEFEKGVISVRTRSNKDTIEYDIDEFVSKISKEIKERTLEL